MIWSNITTRIDATWNVIRRRIKPAWYFMQNSPISLFLLAAICVLAILLASWSILAQKKDDILVEVCGLLFDVILFGIILTFFSDWLDRKKRIHNYYDQLEDFRSWRGEEGVLRKVGIIKRLLKLKARLPNLSNFHLKGADLQGLDLSNVDFSMANLAHARLGGSKLNSADLSGSILRGAYFAGADLTGANLFWANLEGAHLGGANLCGVDLSEVKRLKLRQITGYGYWSAAECDNDTKLPTSLINKGEKELDRAGKIICSILVKNGDRFYIDELYWYIRRVEKILIDYNIYLAAIFLLESSGIIARPFGRAIPTDRLQNGDAKPWIIPSQTAIKASLSTASIREDA